MSETETERAEEGLGAEARWTTMESPTLGKFAEALAKAQGAMSAAAKDSVNPHFRSKYADLASVREAVQEPLSTNNIAYVQRPVPCERGWAAVETRLIHASGEWMSGTVELPVAQATAHGHGSAITYARRFGLSAMTGVAPAEDDDGNAAVGHPPAPKPHPEPRQSPPRAAPKQEAPKPVTVTVTAPNGKKGTAAATGSNQGAVPALCDHEWGIKDGLCGKCGAKEPQAPKQPPALLARISALWVAAKGKGMSKEAFKAWCETGGVTGPSSEWTEKQVTDLEAMAKEPPEPGGEG